MIGSHFQHYLFCTRRRFGDLPPKLFVYIRSSVPQISFTQKQKQKKNPQQLRFSNKTIHQQKNKKRIKILIDKKQITKRHFIKWREIHLNEH